MKLTRSLSIAALLTLAAALTAQKGVNSRENPAALPTVEQQVDILTQKLDLTVGQQAKVKPIMQKLHDQTNQIAQDQKLSPEERLARVRPLRMEAGQKLREFLTDEQKQKLETYLKGPHAEMHGNLSGSAQPHKK